MRLALFAEMVKGRPWPPATLKEVGGTEGVGVTFLEEPYRLGDTRAGMIEGPSREAIELVEVR